MRVNIGEIRISLNFHGFNSLEIPSSYDKFLCNGFQKKDANFDFYSRRNIPEVKGNLIFAADIWNIYESKDKYYLKISYPDSIYPPPRLGIFSKNFSRGKIYCQTGLNEPLYTPLDQIIMTNILSEKGLLVHACGVGINKKGYLFAGRSGKGKTTIARMAKKIGAKVLSDDRIIIRILKNKVWIFGTPWHGDFLEIENDSFILEKIFFLEHGRKNKITSLMNVNGISEIIKHSFPPFWNKKAVDFSVSLSQKIVNKIEVNKLYFREDLDIATLI